MFFIKVINKFLVHQYYHIKKHIFFPSLWLLLHELTYLRLSLHLRQCRINKNITDQDHSKIITVTPNQQHLKKSTPFKCQKNWRCLFFTKLTKLLLNKNKPSSTSSVLFETKHSMLQDPEFLIHNTLLKPLSNLLLFHLTLIAKHAHACMYLL